MRDSTRKGLVWGLAFSLIPIAAVAEYSRMRNEPFTFPFEFVIVTILLFGLMGRMLGGDSR